MHLKLNSLIFLRGFTFNNSLQFHKFDCGEEEVCDGKVKDQVERTKYLRFIMDQKPDWKQHISSLQVRLRMN